MAFIQSVLKQNQDLVSMFILYLPSMLVSY